MFLGMIFCNFFSVIYWDAKGNWRILMRHISWFSKTVSKQPHWNLGSRHLAKDVGRARRHMWSFKSNIVIQSYLEVITGMVGLEAPCVLVFWWCISRFQRLHAQKGNNENNAIKPPQFLNLEQSMKIIWLRKVYKITNNYGGKN